MNTIEDAKAIKTLTDKIDYYARCNGDVIKLGHSLRLRLDVLKEILFLEDDPDYLDGIIGQELDCILESSIKSYCNRT